MSVTSELVDYAFGLKFEDLSKEAVESAKKVILDTIGVLIEGSSSGGTKEIVDTMRDWGGKAESSILIFGDKIPAQQAALINAAMARSHDYDEFHQKAMVHTAAGMVPACLAVAEKVGGISGKDFITSVVLGMDIMARLGLSLKLNFLTTGMSISAQFGPFGIALAAGKILRLNKQEMVHALGIAYSQVSGNVLCANQGTMMVHVQIGLSAQAGILSAVLAQKGIDGPQEVFEGKFGYFPVYFQSQYDPSVITSNLGKQFEINNVSIKYYPCCLCSHTAISAILEITKKGRIDPAEVNEIRVGINQGDYNAVGQPLENKRNPSSFKEALFSLPYHVASALVRGHVSLEDFELEAIQDEKVRAISNKVTPFVDRDIEKQFGRTLGPAEVEVTLKNGRKISQRVDFVKGHPKNPMTMDEVEEKFRKCLPFSARPLAEEKVSALLKALRDLETMKDVSRIADYLK